MTRRRKRINPGRALRLRPTPADLIRILARVEVSRTLTYRGSPCWLWLGWADEHGYGRVSINGRNEWVHRATYAMLRRSIPAGKELDHKCKRPGCCNPYHAKPKEPTANRAATRRRDPIPF